MFGSSSTLATDDPDTAALFGPDAAQGKLSFVVFVILEWLGTGTVLLRRYLHSKINKKQCFGSGSALKPVRIHNTLIFINKYRYKWRQPV